MGFSASSLNVRAISALFPPCFSIRLATTLLIGLRGFPAFFTKKYFTKLLLRNETIVYFMSLITTRYRHYMENQTAKKKTALAVKDEKLERLKKVRRTQAAVEDRDLSDVGLLDEILEEGLAKRERKLGIK
jgi:hypothetical protein